MSSTPPRLVYSLLPRPLFPILGIAFYSFVAASDPRPVGRGVALVGAVCAIIFTLRAIQVASTRVTEAGISQLTWSGRLHLSWADVTVIKRNPFTLSAQGRRMVVPVEAFENTAAAIEYIEARLPSSLVRN
jgi:hypothetical protein